MVLTTKNAKALGKKNLDLKNFILSNIKLTRKELVSAIVEHSGFIYKGKHQRARAWDLVKMAKKSKCDTSFEFRNEASELWICYFDFTFVYVK